MTTPIDFLPVPVPSRQAIANLPSGAGNQATAIDANFVKVNDFLRTRPVGCLPVSSRQTLMWNGYLPVGNWLPWDPKYWPATTFVVPDCFGLLLYVGGSLYIGAANTTLAIAAQLGGAGCPGTTMVQHNQQVPRWGAGGSVALVGRNQLVIGGTCTLSPLITASATASSYVVDAAEMGVQVLA